MIDDSKPENLESESIDSQLSIAMFTALRTRLGAQKSSVYAKNDQKRGNT